MSQFFLLRSALIGICCALLGVVATPLAAQSADEKGVFLVAAPTIGDHRFAKTVILLKRHARGGTIGVIVNRPTEVSLREQFPDNLMLEGHAGALYDGGPVAGDRMVFLVRTRSHAPGNALRVFDNVFLSHDQNLLVDVLRHPVPLLGLRVFQGYASWAPGQLENEIIRGDWYMIEAGAEELFDMPPGRLWEHLAEKSGMPQA